MDDEEGEETLNREEAQKKICCEVYGDSEV